jgi:hypothetical protein
MKGWILACFMALQIVLGSEQERLAEAERSGVKIVWTGETLEARDNERAELGIYEIGKGNDGKLYFRPADLFPML